MNADVNDRVTELVEEYSGQELSMGDLLCDRHDPAGVAFHLVDEALGVHSLTFGELRVASQRFAAALAAVGVGVGDRVATLVGKRAELLIASLGIWRVGAVQVPLFTAFAAPAVTLRVAESGARVVICDAGQRYKVTGDGTQVIVVGPAEVPGDLSFDVLLDQHGEPVPEVLIGAGDPIVQIYTSGTTGLPKAVVVPARALACIQAYMEFGLDVRAEDVYWNAADPGWGYGLYYAIIGPLCAGTPAVLVAGGFSATRTAAVLELLGVTNLAAAPTVYRALRLVEFPGNAKVRLRRATAAGEPLTPEVNEWAPQALGAAVHDHYGQTEAGMLVNNHHHPVLARALRPGYMGHPMPGWHAVVLHPHVDEPAVAGITGRLAFDLTVSQFAWFTGYPGDQKRSAAKFSPDGRYYLTGDLASMDTDGYVQFVSRDDDVILMAGYRIGPFEVESVLLTHGAVAEAAVIAAPDELRGEVVEACIVLRESVVASDTLIHELQQLVRTQYSAHAYPRHIHFRPSLPKTPSGKIQRSVLRQELRAHISRS